jgi:hypothetical protein
MDNWLSWAEMIISWGCYPAFPALAEAYGDIVDVGGWLDAMMTYLAERQYDRFRAVMNNGLWVATHPYIYNHFYQEQNGSPEPRQPDQENAYEGGWHFEYPYDPIMQSHRPGITTVSGDAEYPHGDVIGVAGMGEAFLLKAYDLFGGGAIPVVGTEGGIVPVPTTSGSFDQIDNRYPAVTWNSHAHATLAMFNWIATSAPPWMFGITLWKENDYYEGPAGTIPAVGLMAASAPLYKTVPALDALGNVNPGAFSSTGPGPVVATPDYHFVMLATGFNADWFFNGARAYYEKFRPTVITNADFIESLPYQRSLALTILATPDMGDYTQNQITQRWGNVQIDLITATTETRLATILNQRVKTDKRFG